MSTGLREVVLRCRERLKAGREKCRVQHESGSPALQLSARLADLYDDIVLDVWEQAFQEHAKDQHASGIALVAHGGFGRRDIAPYSDADIMLLSTSGASSLAAKISGNLSRDLVDAGLDVGFSIREPREACRMAWADPVIFSSLSESRLLAGSLHVYSRFFSNLRQGALRRSEKLIAKVVAARREERGKWGETNYLLRPNVKRSRGGLRDIQLVRWIGFARFGEVELDKLKQLGVLSREDHRQLLDAYAFMLRVRAELHFRAGRSQDVMDRGTQMEIAESWGYEGTEAVLPVEKFMQEYFENTRNVRYIAAYFADDARTRSMTSRVYEGIRAKKIDESIRMGPTHIWVKDSHVQEFTSSLSRVLRLMYLANHHRRRIGHKTWQAIRLAMQNRPPGEPGPEAIGAFLFLLSRPGRLASLLRRLHELRVIEQLIPEFGRTRGLLQFNEYHKYTVDAHSIRAVEAATDLEQSEHGMGRRYRRIKDKTLLHLALLIHDIGKGYEEDHCIVGARIARETAKRLELDRASAEILEWLVLKHLITNVAAFRHDLNDPKILLGFAKEVGSIRRLELLTVHAVADLAAVGPEVLNDWKLGLIEELYLRTRRYFETGNLPGDNDEELDAKREAVRGILEQKTVSEETKATLEELSLSILSRQSPQQIANALLDLDANLNDDRTSYAMGEYDPQFNAVKYTVFLRTQRTRIGTFSRVTGALLTCGLRILRADVQTLESGLVWDMFWVSDPDYDHQPPQERIDQVCQRVCRLLDTPDEPLPPYRRTWSLQSGREPDRVNVLPTNVVFDNETLDRHTILSFFTYDQEGLLYRVASAFASLDIDLHFAKIDTHLDQIADVFYVTEQDGMQITDIERQEEIRALLMDVVSDGLAQKA